MMQTQLFSNDITIRRHKNNAASNDANVRANKTKPRDRMRVLDFAIRSGGRIYSKQVARALGVEIHQISGRISEMQAMGMFEDTGEREEGCRILRLVIK